MALSSLEELELIIRENDCPFFETSELEYYLEKNNGVVEDAAYQCLIIKSENTTLSVSGLSCADSSAYFRRLAQRYRKSNSCSLKGG